MQLKGSYKEIWQISYPIFLGNLAHSINQIVDVAYLGNYSKIALDAVTLSGVFFMNLTFIVSGFARGCQIMIARYSGQKEDAKIGKAFDNLLLLALLLSIGIMVFLFFGADFLVSQFISSKAIQLDIKIYLSALTFAVPFVVLSFCFNSFFAGIGETKIITYATICMALTNMILAYGLIFGHYGFEKMGILGAGISFVVAEIVMCLVYLSYFLYHKYHIKFTTFQFNTLNIYTITAITRLSSPIVLQGIIGMSSWQYFFISIEKLGENELAVSGILKSIFIFLGIPVWSVASTSNTVISNLIGQNKIEHVIPALKRLVIFTMSISFLLNLIILIFPYKIISLFTDDQSLLSGILPPFYTMMIGLMFFSSAMIMNQGIIGTGNTKTPALVELFCAIFYVAYCYYFIILKKSSLQIAWGCEVVYWLSLLTYTSIYWGSGIWRKHIKPVEEPAI